MSKLRALYASLIGSALAAENALAATATTGNASNVFGQTKAGNLQLGSGSDAETVIGSIIKNLLTLVTIVAVAYVLWAGFQIMTAGGDEEKVKKGRTTIIYVIVGIIVMWLAYWIVSLVIGSLA